MLAFPTTGGDEWEYERQDVIATLSGFIDAGRVKVFCVNTNHGDSFGNRHAHPRHRSWMQARYDDYIVNEMVPFVRSHCRTPDAAIWTFGASLGGYHAANSLLKHPDIFTRCYALSGVYDMSRFMDGDYDDNFYFNNPVDYMANLTDPGDAAPARGLRHPPRHRDGTVGEAGGSVPAVADPATRAACAISSTTGARRAGHDWPYWRHMIWEYIASA